MIRSTGARSSARRASGPMFSVRRNSPDGHREVPGQRDEARRGQVAEDAVDERRDADRAAHVRPERDRRRRRIRRSRRRHRTIRPPCASGHTRWTSGRRSGCSSRASRTARGCSRRRARSRPAARSRATAGASARSRNRRRCAKPPECGMPSTAISSLIVTGTPSNAGRSGSPAATRRSAASASRTGQVETLRGERVAVGDALEHLDVRLDHLAAALTVPSRTARASSKADRCVSRAGALDMVSASLSTLFGAHRSGPDGRTVSQRGTGRASQPAP